ncbi:hypothetical protein LTR59_010995 [Friedmanniomyces endolithicus]|nr:hypothetical protein LTR94_009930 [Friedmanniomyces endolithicus]KAK0785557.1 hypothetical protein LTR59_010995 [Friedmanniomyces endolithicus]KAK0803098.1 hypothetical protein LTR38_006284 [Friedmanniomyces endolithicus]
MPSAIARKKYGTDINRYLGVELPEDRIHLPDPPSLATRPTTHRNASSAFSFRASIAQMFSTASSGTDTPNRHSGYSSSARRWRSKSTTSALAPETPLKDRTNTLKPTTPASINNTSFLPELHSTPPMPTFRKPAAMTPRSPAPRPAALGSRASLTLLDRVEDTPPLPGGWTPQHDLAICVLDARNYSLPGIVTKIRRTFPSLHGILTTAMIDKRLRQLDQDIEIDYWRVGLQTAKNSVGGTAPSAFTPLANHGSGNKVREATVKNTASAPLVKSRSVSNLLPDSVSFSSAGPSTPTPGAMTHEFFGGHRTNAT